MIKKSYLFGVFALSVLMLSLSALTRSAVFLVILCSVYLFGLGALVIYSQYKRKKQRLLEFQQKERDVELFKRVCENVETNKLFLNGNITLESLSSEMGVGRETLSRVINKYAKMNFRQYLNKYRVEYALDILKEDTKTTFFDICFMSGFNSINSFNSAFRHFLGQSPTDIRQQLLDKRRRGTRPIVIPAWDSYAFA